MQVIKVCALNKMMRKDVVPYRKAEPPHNYMPQFAKPNPNIVNNISVLGVMPSSDLLVQALTALPAPYAVTTNKPASEYAGPGLDYYNQFTQTHISAKTIGL